MTPITRLPLVERLRQTHGILDRRSLFEGADTCLEAAALIEKQGDVIEALVAASEGYRTKNIEGIASQFQPTKPDDYRAMGKLAGEIESAHHALDLALLSAKILGDK